MIPLVRLAARGLMAAGLVLGPATTATSAGATVVDRAKERCVDGIDRRLDRLERAAERVSTAGHLTADHEAVLARQVSETSAGLADLRAEVEAADSAGAVREACSAVGRDLRVYVLVLPRTRLVVAADLELAVADRLGDVADRLEASIDEADAAGEDVTAERADLAAMDDRLSAAAAAAGGVAAAVLDLTAADWNDDHSVLRPAREAAWDARADLRSALRLGREITQRLRRAGIGWAETG